MDYFILWFGFEHWRPWSNRNYSIVSDRVNKGWLHLGLHYLIGQRPFFLFSAIITKFATDISRRATLGSNILSVVVKVDRLMLDEIGHGEKAVGERQRVYQDNKGFFSIIYLKKNV